MLPHHKPPVNMELSRFQESIKKIAPIHFQLLKDASNPQCTYMALNLGKVEKDNGIVCLDGILLCPKKMEINKNLRNAQQHSIQWAEAHGLVNENLRDKVNMMRFAAVTATSLSHNPLADLEIVADLTTFFALLDDIWDNQWVHLNNDVEQLWNILTVFINILRGIYPDLSSVPALEFPYYRGFCSALLDIRRRLSHPHLNLAYFIDSVETYFRGYILGFVNRRVSMARSELNYFNIRKFTLGAQTAFEICLALQNLSLNREVRKHPIFDMMVMNGINILALLNDIISMSKELKENKPENIILLKYQRMKNSDNFVDDHLLQIAFDDVINSYNEEMFSLFCLREGLSHIDQDSLPALEVYYQIIANEIRDNLDYYLTAATAHARYGLNQIDHEEIGFEEMTKRVEN